MGLLKVSSILQKNELENFNFCPSLMGQKFFVCYLEELKKTKSPFEINWPLEMDFERVLENAFIYSYIGPTRGIVNMGDIPVIKKEVRKKEKRN